MPKLTVVDPQPSSPGHAPPAYLGELGAGLWSDIVAAYAFGDRAAYETLAQACAAADLAERCREQIAIDGLMIKSRAVVRDHPCIKHEIAARALACRLLARLGLDLEPVRDGPGRPPGS